MVVFDKRFDESKSISVANENILFGRNIPSFPRFNDGEFKRSVDELYVDVAAADDDYAVDGVVVEFELIADYEKKTCGQIIDQ